MDKISARIAATAVQLCGSQWRAQVGVGEEIYRQFVDSARFTRGGKFGGDYHHAYNVNSGEYVHNRDEYGKFWRSDEWQESNGRICQLE